MSLPVSFAPRAWLLLATMTEGVHAQVVITAHPEGPRGHVPERWALTVETSDAWLLDEAFGLSPACLEALEVRELPGDGQPLRWG